MSLFDIIPHTCLHLDCTCRDIFHAASQCIAPAHNRSEIICRLQEMWMTPADQRPVLPCLSVRSGLDLYLSVMSFPRGSEVIISAINIPDIVSILHHHGLKIVTLDIALETMAPKAEWLEDLITGKTAAILVAHLYGKWFDLDPLISIARKHSLPVIEDCAEVFNGFECLGHVQSDISLFSFGVIKHCTAFGGAIAKVRDKEVYSKMCLLLSSYPNQSHSTYLSKVLKYSAVYFIVNSPINVRLVLFLGQKYRSDIQAFLVSCLRGFPNRLIGNLRHQPSTALLAQMLWRFQAFTMKDFLRSKTNGDYVSSRLPEEVTQVGRKAKINNYWLFPVMVEDPDEAVRILNNLGVAAYRGATQIGLIEADKVNDRASHSQDSDKHYTHEARLLMDHIIYLPINKSMPLRQLDRICHRLRVALSSQVKHCSPVANQHWKFKSKL